MSGVKLNDWIGGILQRAVEEAPAEAGENYFSAGLVWEDQHIGRWVADVEEDGRAKAVLAAQAIGEDEDQAVARRELILSALRAQPPAREDAQPWGYGFRRKSWGDAWSFSGSKEQADDILGYSDGEVQPLFPHPAPDALREDATAWTALADLVSWFTNPVQGQNGMVWVIPAGEQGADDAVNAALAALQAEQKGGA